jgi:hypothetical protein
MDRSSDIRQLVRNELEFDPLVDAVDISVSSIGPPMRSGDSIS